MGSDKNVWVLTVLSALSQTVNFSYRVIMARMVGAEVMGLYQLVMSAYAVIQAITTVGLTSAMSNLTAQYLAVGDREAPHRVRKLCLGLFCCLMLPVGGVTLVCSDAISVHMLGDARTRLGLMLLIPCLTLTAVENLHKNAFYGAGRPIPPALAEVWEQLVRAGAVLLLLVLFLPQYPERAVGLVMCGMIFCEVSSAVTLCTLYRHCFGAERPLNAKGLDKEYRSRIVAIAFPVGTNALLSNLLGAANSALVPRQLVRGGMDRSLAVSKLGVVCGMTMPMLALPTVYLGALNLILMPKLAAAAALECKREMRRLISEGMDRVCALTVPCMTAMAVFGGEFGRVLYGRDDVGEYLLPLTVTMGIGCAVGVLATALNSIGMQKRVAGISLIGGGVQVVCTFFFTALPGVEMGGFVFGALASAVLELVLFLHAVDHATGMRPALLKWLLRPGLAAALAGLDGGLLLRVLRNGGITCDVALLTAAAFFAVQYWLVLRLLDKRIDENA